MKSIKRMAAILLALLLVLGLTACSGANSVRSNKGIGEDLLALKSKISDYGLHIDKVSVTKRQTRKDELVDRVWADVTASSDHVRYSGSWELTYGLYDSGWMLDKWNIVEDNAEPKTALTKEKVTADMEALGYTNVVITDITPYGMSADMHCEGTQDGRRYSGGYQYTFDTKTGTWKSFVGSMWGM